MPNYTGGIDVLGGKGGFFYSLNVTFSGSRVFAAIR